MTLPVPAEPHLPASLVANGYALTVELERIGVLTETGLNLTILDVDYDQAEALAAFFGRVRRAASWALGDLIAYSERKFSDVWPQIAEASQLEPQTAANYASVCRRVAPERRRASLGISVHEVVAKLPPKEQERWLDRAERQQMSRTMLREAIRAETTDEHEHRWVCADCGEIRG